MNLGQKHHLAIATALAATSAFATLGLGAGTASASLCTPSGYYWNGNLTLSANNPVHNTGIVIPAPLAGQELKVNQVTYSVSDSSEYSRLDPAEQNEQFGITIGGDAVGGLSADLPDDEASAFSTGVHNGSFGANGGYSNGGELQFRHASTFGHDGTNSFTINAVSVYVVICTEPAPTTTEPAPTTTEAPVAATTQAPTTTAAPQPEPVVEVRVGEAPAPVQAVVTTTEPTTSVAEVAPVIQVNSQAKPAVKAAADELPATGGETGAIAIVALFMTLVGSALLFARRRPAQA